MNQKLYYTPPSDEIFNEIKQAAMTTWRVMHDDEYGYVTEKIDRIKDLQNVKDNYMYMIAMFDLSGRKYLLSMLTPEARQRVLETIA